jgi:hypothetical protein
MRIWANFSSALIALALAALPAKAQGVFGNQVTCNAAAVYDTSVSGLTTLTVAAPTGSIYVCVVFAATNTVGVGLTFGTGALASAQTKITPSFQFATTTGGNEVVADSASPWRGLFVPPGNNLYLNTSAATAVQAIVYYFQQNTR